MQNILYDEADTSYIDNEHPNLNEHIYISVPAQGTSQKRK